MGPIRRRGGHGSGSRPTKEGSGRLWWLISPFSSIHGPFHPHPRQQCRFVCRSPNPVSRWGEFSGPRLWRSGNPAFIDRGEGAHIWDADGQRYIDFCCSWGPPSWGTPTRWFRTAFSGPSRMERRLGPPPDSKMSGGHDPRSPPLRRAHSVRLQWNGGGDERIRLARGVTGKTKILKFEGCYHGHVDALLVKAGSGLATLGTSTVRGRPRSVRPRDAGPCPSTTSTSSKRP